MYAIFNKVLLELRAITLTGLEAQIFQRTTK